jgi:DNA-binding MarR family transcriptional regulator
MAAERSPSKARLSGVVAYRIARANAEMVRLLTLLCEANGFKFNVWKVFSAIGSYEPISAVEISRHTTIDKAMVSRVIRQLLDRKLIERSLDENDARSVRIQLTEAGKAAYIRTANGIDDLQKRLLANVPADKVNELIDLLDMLEKRTKDVIEAAQTDGLAEVEEHKVYPSAT